MKYTKEEQKEAKARLLEWIKPGDTLYTILRHRSSSGMSRVIDVKLIRAEYSGDLKGMSAKARVLHIGYNVAIVLGLPYDKREGIKIGGCGMDMGFHIVYELGAVLFGHGDEARAYNYHTGRNGDKGPENDGGYFLNHSWL